MVVIYNKLKKGAIGGSNGRKRGSNHKIMQKGSKKFGYMADIV